MRDFVQERGQFSEDRDGPGAASTDRILERFAPLQRHLLSKAGRVVQRFDLEPSDLQRKLLDFLGIIPKVFRNV